MLSRGSRSDEKCDSMSVKIWALFWSADGSVVSVVCGKGSMFIYGGRISYLQILFLQISQSKSMITESSTNIEIVTGIIQLYTPSTTYKSNIYVFPFSS